MLEQVLGQTLLVKMGSSSPSRDLALDWTLAQLLNQIGFTGGEMQRAPSPGRFGGFLFFDCNQIPAKSFFRSSTLDCAGETKVPFIRVLCSVSTQT